MTFRKGEGEEFKKIFNASKKSIREMRGCIFLELLEDLNDADLFFTYSVWSSEDDLNRYRHSDLYKEIWPKTKALFAAEPEVHSMKRIEKA